MNNVFTCLNICKKSICLVILFFFVTIAQFSAVAQNQAPLRRPISPSSPMWLVHIDTWVWPDPQKCIELIPEDVRPYVVFNISLSVSDFVKGKYPFTIAESWLRSCAANGVWATIQPSSGGKNNFPNVDLVDYEYFYANYPNFIGWNFCEQCWGFEGTEFYTRLQLFTNLLKMGNKYGGYLIVSNTQTINAPHQNAVAMLKLDPALTEAARMYKENYIVCEKYTTTRGFYDIESTCLGTFLSGYCGNYGIRFDECGWNTETQGEFPEATGIVPILGHFLLTGETVTDGPELTSKQTILKGSATNTTDGYKAKRLYIAPQFINISIDNFRKVLDGTVRIPTRDEVIARTKIAIVNDINSGSVQDQYSSEKSLFTGLYAMDGEWSDNNTWAKKTGRYPSIPIIFKEGDYETGAFETVVKRTAYLKRWPTIQSKVDEFNELFPAEYTGDLYAARINNSWMTYNPYMFENKVATALIPLRYNTCDSIRLSYAQYASAVINEYGDKLQFYLNNYCTNRADMREDIITVYGSIGEPTYTFTDRGEHKASTVIKSWENGILTLTVKHNGPLDLIINCAGNAIDRMTEIPTVTIVPPTAPATYTGPRQYEAEDFEYKNISSADQTSEQDYTAMGYLVFGDNAQASVRRTVNVLRKGDYLLKTRYSAPNIPITTVEVYVNGTLIGTPRFSKTMGWGVNVQNVVLNAGNNLIEFRAKRSTSKFLLDNIIVEDSNSGIYDFSYDVTSNEATVPAAQLVTVCSGTAGVVSYTDADGNTDNCFKTYSTGEVNSTGVADLNMFQSNATDYSIVWKEYYQTAGAKKGVLLRSGNASSYAAGMKQGYLFTTTNNADNSIDMELSVVGEAGITLKQSYTSNLKVVPGKPCWYRATAIGNKLMFECSADSVNWEGEATATFTDDTYVSGSTQLVWGLGSGNFSWMMDNITCLAGNISVSAFALDGLVSTHNSESVVVDSFVVSGHSLVSDIEISQSGEFEVSLEKNGTYTSLLALVQENGTVAATTVYVRLKPSLSIGTYSGEVTVTSKGTTNHDIVLSGEVLPRPISVIYDFSADKVSNKATTPPALNTTIGRGNGATAGVVSYTDSEGITGNMLKPYSGGLRNSTGIIDLDLFPKEATDYSVTWKQCVGSATDDYKIGVLLRGDTENLGTASVGYVQGIMRGYVFIAYLNQNQSRTYFRIYKSTASTSLTMLVSADVATFSPAVKQPVWFRASVSGSNAVSLKLEYSTDGGATWNEGISAIDTSSSFRSGATQIVWGLGVGNVDFYLDDIAFHGFSNDDTSIIAPELSDDTATVVSEEYYTIMGQRMLNLDKKNLQGIYIVRRHMSNGMIDTRKVYFE